MATLPTTLPASILELRFDDDVPVLVYPSHLDLDGLRALTRTQLTAHLPAIKGKTCRLDLGDRNIEHLELRRLLHTLRADFQIDITGLYAISERVTRFAERELKLKLFPLVIHEPELELVQEEEPEETPFPELELVVDDPLDAPMPAAAQKVEEDVSVAVALEVKPTLETREPAREMDPVGSPLDHGRRTQTVHRTLRSGAVVRFDGDVFVFGDVNPGAQVIASGNIVILGACKGVAHAGATGDAKAFLFALELRPTQLRIAHRIAIPPDPGKVANPELARIVSDKIIVEKYRGRTRF